MGQQGSVAAKPPPPRNEMTSTGTPELPKGARLALSSIGNLDVQRVEVASGSACPST